MDSTVASLIESLAKTGWTDEQFMENHLNYAAAVCLGTEVDEARSSFDRYWRSVGRITAILQDAEIFHVVLKTRRNYPYCDTNVDVFIEDSAWPTVRDILCNDSWRMPSRTVRLKQRLIEREKIKLPPRDKDLIPAHIYKAVSWRYQREVTFFDPQMVEAVPLTTEAPHLDQTFGALLVPMPTRAADILLHCAEIVFENYRITLGETLYLSWLMQHVSSLDKRRVYRLGIDRGAGHAMRCVLSHLHQCREKANEEGFDTEWPRNLPGRQLLASWWERLRAQCERNRTISGVEEWLGYASFASMYRIKRSWFG